MTDTTSFKKTFDDGMKQLEAAFMKQPPKETLKIYREKLEWIGPERFMEAVDLIIQHDRWFPPISRFMEIRLEYKDPYANTIN